MIDLEKIRNEKPIKDLINFSIINIDKPTGPTSFQISHYVKHGLKLDKTGHFGTLDPNVTGVLPIALGGRACRLNDYLMHKDKTYVGIMNLHKEISQNELKKQISHFIGKINQLPPVKSRVKRAVREREVKSFDMLEINGKNVLFVTKVQAGTYIRKLVHDIGENIGGANMLELRRIEAGAFLEKDSTTLYDFDKAVEEYKIGNELPLRRILIPGEIILNILPSVEVEEEYLKKLMIGAPLFKKFIKSDIKFEKEEKITVHHQGKFIGCYRVVNEGDILAKAEFVFN